MSRGFPLERGDVDIPARVHDPVPTTEVGQVGLAVNAMLDHVESSPRRARTPRNGSAASCPTPATSCARRSPRSAATPS